MNVRTLTEKALLLSLTLVVASLSTPVKASESVVWDLTGVYANDEAWESALETAQDSPEQESPRFLHQGYAAHCAVYRAGKTRVPQASHRH